MYICSQWELEHTGPYIRNFCLSSSSWTILFTQAFLGSKILPLPGFLNCPLGGNARCAHWGGAGVVW